MKQYKLVACGGTFDHFHKGHREFLRFALEKAERLIIGITSSMFSDNKREEVESFSIRKENVCLFLKQEQVFDRVEILSIDNVYGPTLLPDSKIEGLIVSVQTKWGADSINNKRKELGFLPLDVVVCSTTKAQDGEIISSSRIRNGEIDREGKLFIQPEWLKKNRRLTMQLRTRLKNPLGTFLSAEDIRTKKLNPLTTIAVGDVVTKMCNDMSFKQKISVVDFFVQRQKKYTKLKELGFQGQEVVTLVDNPAGGITASLFHVAKNLAKSLQEDTLKVVLVNGEEDLAVLPFLLALPLGWTVLYGQPHTGVVRLEVTEQTKRMIAEIVSECIL